MQIPTTSLNSDRKECGTDTYEDGSRPRPGLKIAIREAPPAIRAEKGRDYIFVAGSESFERRLKVLSGAGGNRPGNAAANDSGKAKKYSRIFRNIETDKCRKHRQPPTDASPSSPPGNADEPSDIRKKKSYCREYFRQYDFIKTYFRPALRLRDARTAQPFGHRPDGAGLPDNPDNRRTNRYPTLVVALI